MSCVNNFTNLEEEKKLAALHAGPGSVLFLVLWTRLCSILWKQLKPRSCFVFYSKFTYIHDKACGPGPTNVWTRLVDWWWMPLCNPGVRFHSETSSFRTVFIPTRLHSSIRKLKCTISGLGLCFVFSEWQSFFRNDEPKNYFWNEPSEIGNLHFGMKICRNEDFGMKMFRNDTMYPCVT